MIADRQAASVILYRQFQLVAPPAKVYPHIFGSRVSRHIRQGFLHNAIQIDLFIAAVAGKILVAKFYVYANLLGS